MGQTKRLYSKKEFARRGDAIFRSIVAPRLCAEDEGKFAAIDIETGAYVVDTDEMKACDKLGARRANSQIWLVRIGSRYVFRIASIPPLRPHPSGESKIQNLKPKIDR